MRKLYLEAVVFVGQLLSGSPTWRRSCWLSLFLHTLWSSYGDVGFIILDSGRDHRS